jgi:hypothetical protein
MFLLSPGAWTSPPANLDDEELCDDPIVVPHEPSRVTCVAHVETTRLCARLSVGSSQATVASTTG